MDINITSQVLTYANLAAFPVTGLVKTIYIALDTDISYYWNGSAYDALGSSGGVQSVTGDGVDNSDPLNPVLTFPTPNDIGAYTTTEVDNEISLAVVGLLDDRGNYDASVNTFPASGGSGTAGAILKGDLWTISVGGTLGGNVVSVGDVVRALVDSPGQTSSNWAVTENNIGYVPENNANKVQDFSDPTSTTKFGSIKAVVDYIVSLAYITASYVTTALATFKTDNFLDATSTIQGQLDSRSTRVFKTTTDSSHTGDTNITKVFSALITGNTITVGDIGEYRVRFRKTGTAGIITVRCYVNSTDDLSGSPVLIASRVTASASDNIHVFERMFFVKTTTNTEDLNAATTTIQTIAMSTTVGVTAANIDWTTNKYFIITVQLGNSGDTATLSGAYLLKQ